MNTKKTVPELEQKFLEPMAEQAAQVARDEYNQARHEQEHGVSAVFKTNDTEILRTIPAATEFYEMYEYQPLRSSRPLEINPLDCPPVRPIRFMLSEKDSEGRYVYLPAN